MYKSHKGHAAHTHVYTSTHTHANTCARTCMHAALSAEHILYCNGNELLTLRALMLGSD